MAYASSSSSDPTQDLQGGYTWSEAAEYVRDRWEDFVQLAPAIGALQHRWAVATADGTLSREVGHRLIEATGELRQVHGSIVDRVDELSSWIGLSGWRGSSSPGLGAIPVPVWVATAFATLALGVAWVFRRYEYLEGLSDRLASGELTVEDLEVLELQGSPPGDLLDQGLEVGRLLLWGAGLLLALQLLRSTELLPNPDLVLVRNPEEDAEGRVRIGEHVYALVYRHAENSQPYYHDFGPGVEVWGTPDGAVVLDHPELELWDDFP